MVALTTHSVNAGMPLSGECPGSPPSLARQLAREHASLIVGLARDVRDGMAVIGPQGDPDYLARLTEDARRAEQRANELVRQARKEGLGTARIMAVADQAADALEGCLFPLEMLPVRATDTDEFNRLRATADAVVEVARVYARTLDLLQGLWGAPGGPRKGPCGPTPEECDRRGGPLLAEVARKLGQAAESLTRAAQEVRATAVEKR
jgi:hypothetical protein